MATAREVLQTADAASVHAGRVRRSIASTQASLEGREVALVNVAVMIEVRGLAGWCPLVRNHWPRSTSPEDREIIDIHITVAVEVSHTPEGEVTTTPFETSAEAPVCSPTTEQLTKYGSADSG